MSHFLAVLYTYFNRKIGLILLLRLPVPPLKDLHIIISSKRVAGSNPAAANIDGDPNCKYMG